MNQWFQTHTWQMRQTRRGCCGTQETIVMEEGGCELSRPDRGPPSNTGATDTTGTDSEEWEQNHCYYSKHHNTNSLSPQLSLQILKDYSISLLKEFLHPIPTWGWGISPTPTNDYHIAAGCPVIPFWHCLQGDIITSHRLKVQSNESAPHPFKHTLVDTSLQPKLPMLLIGCKLEVPTTTPPPKASGSPECSLHTWSISYPSKISTTPSLGTINLLDRLTELQEMGYLLGHRFLVNQPVTQDQPNRRHTEGKVCGRKHGASPRARYLLPHIPACSPTWELSGPQTLGFSGGFIT